jgi:cell division protein FtsQ
LPEVGTDRAVNRLAALDREDGLLARDILAVDMRFSDRLVVQLSPEAQTARQAMLTAKAKSPRRKAETKI